MVGVKSVRDWDVSLSAGFKRRSGSNGRGRYKVRRGVVWHSENATKRSGRMVGMRSVGGLGAEFKTLLHFVGNHVMGQCSRLVSAHGPCVVFFFLF